MIPNVRTMTAQAAARRASVRIASTAMPKQSCATISDRIATVAAPSTEKMGMNTQTKTLDFRFRVVIEPRRYRSVLLARGRGCYQAKRYGPQQWVNRRDCVVNSKGTHFAASRHIIGCTSAKRCATNRRCNRRNRFRDFGYPSSRAIAGN